MTEAKSEQGSRYLWAVLAACVGVFAVAYNTTAVMTALPAMKSDLDLDVDTVQWVVNAYMLAAATSLAALGHFADMFGMLRIFLFGLAAFAAGAIAIAAADGAVLVLLGRAFQGIGIAAIMATSVAMISIASPKGKRGAGLGLFAASVAFGFALGPLIGGAFTDAVSWRAIFALDLVNLAAAASICIVVARLRLVPPAMEIGTRIDYPGLVLLVAALGCFLYGLTSGQLTGWASLQTFVLFGVSILTAIGFAIRELHAEYPLINFRFFRHADYAASAGAMFALGFALIGVLLFVNLYLQAPDGYDFSPGKAGLALLPFTAAMLIISLTAPRMLDPGALRWPVAAAFLALVLAYWLMRDPGSYGNLWWKLPLVGIGAGLGQALLPRVGLRVLPDASAGQASGVINTCFFAGLAAGTAVGGVVTSLITRSVVDPMVERLAPHAEGGSALDVALVHGSPSEIAAALKTFSPEDAAKIEATLRGVYDTAFGGVMITMAVMALAGAVLCATVIRKRGRAD